MSDDTDVKHVYNMWTNESLSEFQTREDQESDQEPAIISCDDYYSEADLVLDTDLSFFSNLDGEISHEESKKEKVYQFLHSVPQSFPYTKDQFVPLLNFNTKSGASFSEKQNTGIKVTYKLKYLSVNSAVKIQRVYKKNSYPKPKRPLSAYNLFFQAERLNILDALEKTSKTTRKITPNINNGNSFENPLSSSQTSDNLDFLGKLFCDRKQICFGLPCCPKQTTQSNPFPPTMTKNKRGRPRGKNFVKRRAPHGKISFSDLAKLIGLRWKSVKKGPLDHYKKIARLDKMRYEKELDLWKNASEE